MRSIFVGVIILIFSSPIHAEDECTKDSTPSMVVSKVKEGARSAQQCLNDLRRDGLNKNVLIALHELVLDSSEGVLDIGTELQVHLAVLQGYRNGKIDIDPSPYFDRASCILLNESPKAEDKSKAIEVLAFRDDQDAVSKIGKFVVQSEEKWVFRTAVSELSMMCNQFARNLLEERANESLLEEDRKQFILDTLEESGKFKKRVQWCG